MKNITYFLIALGLIAMLTSKAQPIDFELQTSKEVKYKLKEWTNGVKAMGLIEDKVYYHNYVRTVDVANKNKHFVTKLDTTLSNIERIQLDLNYKNKEMDFESIELINGKVYLFTSFQNKKLKKHFFFAQILDTKTLERLGEITVLGELTYNAFEKYKRTTFYHTVSEDKQKILLYFSILSDEDVILRNEMYVVSPELEFIWGYENAYFGDGESDGKYIAFQISNYGEVYVLFIAYKKFLKKDGDDNIYECEIGENKFSYRYKISKLTQNLEERKIYELVLSDKTIREANITLTDDYLVVNGVYSDKNTFSETGAFLFNVDFFTKEIKDIETADFGWDLIIQDLSDQELEKVEKLKKETGEWDIYYYDISDIHTKSDGNKYFTATQKQRVTINRVDVYFTYFKNNGIYIVHLDKENKIDKLNKMSKTQYYLSTTFYQDEIELENKGSLYFIYNNTFQKKNKKGKTTQKTDTEVIQDHPDICAVNEQGQTKLMQYKEVPLKGFNPARFILPSSAIKLNHNTAIYQVTSKSGFSNYYEKVRIIE